MRLTLFMLAVAPASLFVLRPQPALHAQLARAVTPLASMHLQPREPAPPQLATAPSQRRGGWIQRTLRQLLTVTAVAGAGVLLRVPGYVSPAEAVPTTKVRAKKTGPSIKKKGGKSQGGLASVVIVGGISFATYKVCAEEDREEMERIVDETDKMEKMEKEFTDIDEGVVADDDLLASLKKRMNSTDGSAPPTGTPDDLDDGFPGPPSADGGNDPPDSGGGAAVLEPPPAGGDVPSAPSAPSAEPSPGASEADIERLKRMFGSSQDE